MKSAMPLAALCLAGTLAGASRAQVTGSYAPKSQPLVAKLAGKVCTWQHGSTVGREVFELHPDGKLWVDQSISDSDYRSFEVIDAAPSWFPLHRYLELVGPNGRTGLVLGDDGSNLTFSTTYFHILTCVSK
jgi:hypothetical protein